MESCFSIETLWSPESKGGGRLGLRLPRIIRVCRVFVEILKQLPLSGCQAAREVQAYVDMQVALSAGTLWVADAPASHDHDCMGVRAGPYPNLLVPCQRGDPAAMRTSHHLSIWYASKPCQRVVL